MNKAAKKRVDKAIDKQVNKVAKQQVDKAMDKQMNKVVRYMQGVYKPIDK